MSICSVYLILSDCDMFFTVTVAPLIFVFFFFNDTATTEIYTLSLHDALPISVREAFPTEHRVIARRSDSRCIPRRPIVGRDRKSTRLNSSHSQISYAVFCLKKKKKND